MTTLLLWEHVLRDEGNDAALRAHALDVIHHRRDLSVEDDRRPARRVARDQRQAVCRF